MKQRKPNKKIKVARNCIFCDKKIVPDYKDISVLGKYVSERGKLLGKAKTGICSKHQRQLTNQVKRARHVALLPFIVRI